MCKILIVEPSICIVNEMINVLEERLPYIELILHAGDYNNAIKLFDTHNPDLILLNIDTDSEYCFSIIEKMNTVHKKMVILLIDEDNTQYLKKILRKRNERFILKPLDKNNFFTIIHGCMKEIEITKGDTKIIKNLTHKVQQLKPHIEHNIVLNLAANTQTDLLLHDFKLLDHHFCEGVVALVPRTVQRTLLTNIITAFKTIKSCVICSDYHTYYVLVIVSDDIFQPSDICKMKHLVRDINEEKFIMGIGNIKRDLASLYQSYNEAFDNFVSSFKMSIQNPLSPISMNQMHYYIEHIFLTFLMINEYSVKTWIKEFTSAFSIYDIATKESIIFNFDCSFRKMISYAFKADELVKEDTCITVYNLELNTFDCIYQKILDIYETITTPIQFIRYDIPHTQLRKVLYYIHNHHTEKQISLQIISTDLQISTYYICKLFKNYTETSFIEFLNSCRIEHAKILLKSNSKISNIAYEVGYKSTTYFGRVFKNTLGMTPKEYRTHNSVFSYTK